MIAASTHVGAVGERQRLEPIGKRQYIERHRQSVYSRSDVEPLQVLARSGQAILQIKRSTVTGRRDDQQRHMAGIHHRTTLERELVPVHPAEDVRSTIAKNLLHRFNGMVAPPFQFDQARMLRGNAPVHEIDVAVPVPGRVADPRCGGTLIEPSVQVSIRREHDDGFLEHRLVGRVVGRNVGGSSEFPKPFGS